jgi:type IV secretory pathway TraG/TraD family ATPase VirD4
MGSHWLNPNDPRTFGPRAAKIAEGCVRETDEKTAYWYSSSRELVQAFIMFYAKHGKRNERNLPHVARMISEDVFSVARWMMKKTNDPYMRARLARYAANGAEDIRSLNEVIENTRTELNFLLEQPIAETLSGESDVTFSRCKRKTVSIYVILPAEIMDGRFLKLLFCSALGELLRNDAKGNKRTLIMADEYYTMGIKDGDKAFATARKFNTQLWICLQDMDQLKKLHPRNSETFINNAGVVQWLDANDLDGSEYLSRLGGDTEFYGINKSINEDMNQGGYHISDSMGQHGRRLILPHEVRELGPREQILRVTGVKGLIRAVRKPYWEAGLRGARRSPFYQKQGFWRKIFG